MQKYITKLELRHYQSYPIYCRVTSLPLACTNVVCVLYSFSHGLWDLYSLSPVPHITSSGGNFNAFSTRWDTPLFIPQLRTQIKSKERNRVTDKI